MPWNLFIFPLVAGYFWITRAHYFKFTQQRLDKQRLIYETVLKGTYLGATVLLIRFLIIHFCPQLYTWVVERFPYKQPYLITSTSTLVFAFVFVLVGNKIFNERKQLIKAIHKIGSLLEKILEYAFSNKRLILLTLKSDKVYVGWVTFIPIPGVSKYIKILPVYSGFRTKEKEVRFTTNYLSLYKSTSQSPRKTGLDWELEKVILMDEILSCSIFNPEFYKKVHLQKIKEQTQSASKTSGKPKT